MRNLHPRLAEAFKWAGTMPHGSDERPPYLEQRVMTEWRALVNESNCVVHRAALALSCGVLAIAIGCSMVISRDAHDSALIIANTAIENVLRP